MVRYRHYRNCALANETMYAITTCLDFAHLFGIDKIKNKVVSLLRSNCAYYGATLHAYVLMSNHFHVILNIREGRTAGWLTQRIKGNIAKTVQAHVEYQWSSARLFVEGWCPERGLSF